MAAAARLANQGPPAIVEWDPEPTKIAVKEVYDVGLTALATVGKVQVKALAVAAYGPASIPVDIALTVAIHVGVNKVKEVAKAGTDALADSCYETPASTGSRVAQWYGYRG